jgi:hypothetical protein
LPLTGKGLWLRFYLLFGDEHLYMPTFRFGFRTVLYCMIARIYHLLFDVGNSQLTKPMALLCVVQRVI